MRNSAVSVRSFLLFAFVLLAGLSAGCEKCGRRQAVAPDSGVIAEALALAEAGDYEQAEVLLRTEIEQLAALDGEAPRQEKARRGQLWLNLGRAHYMQGELEQAEHAYQQALPLLEEGEGPYHPDTAKALTNLGAVYYARKKYDEAAVVLERAVRVSEAMMGEMDPLLLAPLNNLAAAYQGLERYKEAEAVYLRVLHIAERNPVVDDRAIVSTLGNLAHLYARTDRKEKAAETYEKAINAIGEPGDEAERRRLHGILLDYAAFATKMGDAEKAASLAALAEATGAPDQPEAGPTPPAGEQEGPAE